jgi:hypothetical protein
VVRHSITLVMPPDLFALVIFEVRFLLYTWASLDCNSLICASHLAGMAVAYHHTQLFLVEMGSFELFT